VAGCFAYREAAVAAGESPDFPFSDPITFTAPKGPLTDAEIPY
jgi:hypothetical protein